MKRLLIGTALAVLLAAPALATECPRHLRAIDEALTKNPQLTAAQMTDVKKARDDGDVAHKAAKHADSLAAFAKAEAILKIKP